MKEGQKLIGISRWVFFWFLSLFLLGGCVQKEIEKEIEFSKEFSSPIPPECRNYILDEIFGECPEWEKFRK